MGEAHARNEATVRCPVERLVSCFVHVFYTASADRPQPTY